MKIRPFILSAPLFPYHGVFEGIKSEIERYEPEPEFKPDFPTMIIQYQKNEDMWKYDELFDNPKRPYKRPSQKKRRIDQRRRNSKRF